MILQYYARQQFLRKEENSAVLELRDTDNARAVEGFWKTSNLVVRIYDTKTRSVCMFIIKLRKF